MINVNCRLCESLIDSSPLLSMSPFPKAAQYYPVMHEFKKDIGVELEVFKCQNCGVDFTRNLPATSLTSKPL